MGHKMLVPVNRLCRLSSRAGCVYIMYDAVGIILYIGQTTNFAERMKSHRGLQWRESNVPSVWMKYVRRVSMTPFPSRTEALAEERRLIEMHQPPFNTFYTDRDPRKKRGAA